MSDYKQQLQQQYRTDSNLNARLTLHGRFSTNKYGFGRWVFDRFDLPAECRILELGCGNAWVWAQNMHRVSDGWEIALTDVAPGMLEGARKNLAAQLARFSFAIADAEGIGYGDATFDAVIANHMLYHVEDRERAFAEICRVLTPAGQFYATTNGENHMRELGELVRDFDANITALSGDNAASFGLENGTEQLGRWFSNVTLHPYDDALHVTEAEPLIAYVLSTRSNAKKVLVGEKLAAFRDYVRSKITQGGCIPIAKDSGLFVASGPIK